MSLRKPFFTINPSPAVDSKDDTYIIRHNSNGLGFTTQDEVDKQTGHLILLALQEGMRMRSEEINNLLNNK